MRKLWVQLSAAFLLIAWVSVGLMTLGIHAATESAFRQYVNAQSATDISPELAARLEASYAAAGGWSAADALLGGGRGAGGTGRRSSLLVADMQGVIQAATDPALVGAALTDDEQNAAQLLRVAGVQVGWLARRTPGGQALGTAEAAFLEQASRLLVAAWLGVSAAALVAGLVLAWVIARPISALTAAVRDLAAGQLGRQVRARGSEETIALAAAFNTLSARLAEGESLRKRMAADIAHELRTPLAVLRGQLEAMRDGVLPADDARLAAATDQTLMLGRLVDDLRLLTLAEAGQLPLERQPLALAALLREAAAGFQPFALDAGVTLTCIAADDLPRVSVDPLRLRQVLGNLLANALRHTPPGGAVTVRGERDGPCVRVTVENTGSTLTPEQAARVFDPFWRADPSRATDGGSGLGLAIARQLIALHGGRIWIDPLPSAVAVRFTLPLDEPQTGVCPNSGGITEQIQPGFEQRSGNKHI
jgi:signal transduction histidine kinase